MRSLLWAVVLVGCGPKVAPEPAVVEDDGQYDVIIVGAGLAGLTAARVLREAGVDFVVLEATDRIGGRGLTDPHSGIDLGGAWIHGTQTNPLFPIVHGLGYETRPTNIETTPYLFVGDHFASADDALRFDTVYEAFEADLEERVYEGADVSSALALDAAAEALTALGPVEGQAPDAFFLDMLALNAGPLESAAELASTSSVDGDSFLADPDELIAVGFGTFVEDWGALVADRVRTGHRVERITHDADGVSVEAGGETFRARKVLVTVSTGVLASGAIAFSPTLPDWKTEAIAGLPMGLMNKVIVEYRDDAVFPLHQGQAIEDTWVVYGGAVDDTADDLAYVLRPLGLPIAIGFFGGDRAWALEAQPDHGEAEMVSLANAGLDAMCRASRPDPSGCGAAAAQTRATITAWGSTDWTRGAYSVALPGQVAMREVLARPIEHRVYFAGEAASRPTYNGSFAGAYSSGQRAAYGIVRCLAAENRGEPCVWR